MKTSEITTTTITIRNTDPRRAARFMELAETWAVGCVDNVAYDDYRWDKVVPNTIEEFAESVWNEIASEGEADPHFAMDLRFIGKDNAMPAIRRLVISHIEKLKAEGYEFPNAGKEIGEAR